MSISPSAAAMSVSPARSAARSNCFATRGGQFVAKAQEATAELAGKEKRRLKQKIASVMIEVKKRQGLHQIQEKQKKFREKRFAAGRGAYPAQGDSDQYALGLACLSNTATAQTITSPRRTALLDSLSLEEFFLLREDPNFFFTGNAISAAVRPGDHQAEPTTDVGDTAQVPKSLFLPAVDASVFEELIDFFSVAVADMDLPVPTYVRHLRAELLKCGERRRVLEAAGADIDWRQKLCRSNDELPAEPVGDPFAWMKSTGPLEMMPMMGRHPAIRDNQQSPTLLRVREVYERRDEQDAEFCDGRREKLALRLATNTFKCSEQARELTLDYYKQAELHKVRMLQAEEKKFMLQYEMQERTEVMGMQKIHRIMVANERLERLKGEKRDQIVANMADWEDRVQQGAQNVLKAEVEKREDGAKRHEVYMKKLVQIGEKRLNVAETQGHKNDELKTKIQVSLCQQDKDRREMEGFDRTATIGAKQDAAALRRHYHQLGNRYCLTQKAFGATAVGFDAKTHSVAVDRRGKSWKKIAANWEKTKHSFSAPVLPTVRPLSPGGALDEAEFNLAITKQKNYKMAMSQSNPAVGLGASA